MKKQNRVYIVVDCGTLVKAYRSKQSAIRCMNKKNAEYGEDTRDLFGDMPVSVSAVEFIG